MNHEEKAALMGAPVEFGMTTSSTLGKLAAALAKAQLKMAPAFKAARNPHHGNWYADLAACHEAIKPLHEEGIAVVQPPFVAREGFVGAQTLLVHGESGEWIRGVLEMPVVPQTKKDGTRLPIDAQTYGSALTYARRYCLASTCGLSQSDDDAEASASKGREQQAAPTQNGAAKPGPAKTQAKAAPAPKAAPAKQEAAAPPPPPPEEPEAAPANDEFPPPDAEEVAEERVKVADAIKAVDKASGPELLISTWALRDRVDPAGHELLWSSILERGAALIKKATKEDLTAWHRTIMDCQKPEAWTKAYMARFNEIKTQQATT